MVRTGLMLLLALIIAFTFTPARGQEPVPGAEPETVVPVPAAADEDITDEELQKKFEILAKVIDIVSGKYVDRVNRRKLVEGALRGIMAELDPHSNFLTRDDMEEMHIDLEGELEGIGVYITLDDNNILSVITPIEDTPAYKAGVLAGDKIIEIDGESTKGISLHEAVKKIRGKRGSAVVLKVYHIDLKTDEVISIVREKIPILSVKEVHMEDEAGKIGYLRLTAFQRTSRDEIREAVDTLLAQGMQGLVFDLRDNGGGLLSSAIEIADLFLDKGIIVSVKGRDESDLLPPAQATMPNTYKEFPIVILINGYSASASEIVSAALRDNHRAILLGEKSFGKGSVQKLIPLDDGSGIKLTIQRYYTPRGVSIDKTGIEPDVVEEMTIETKIAIQQQRTRRLVEKNRVHDETAVPGTETAPETPTAPVVTPAGDETVPEVIDTQLQRAVDILKGVQILKAQLTAGAAD